jgi:hypothetical protein
VDSEGGFGTPLWKSQNILALAMVTTTARLLSRVSIVSALCPQGEISHRPRRAASVSLAIIASGTSTRPSAPRENADRQPPARSRDSTMLGYCIHLGACGPYSERLRCITWRVEVSDAVCTGTVASGMTALPVTLNDTYSDWGHLSRSPTSGRDCDFTRGADGMPRVLHARPMVVWVLLSEVALPCTPATTALTASM